MLVDMLTENRLIMVSLHLGDSGLPRFHLKATILLSATTMWTPRFPTVFSVYARLLIKVSNENQNLVSKAHSSTTSKLVTVISAKVNFYPYLY